MPPSIRVVAPEHELGTPGLLALTEESTDITKRWPGDIRSVPGSKPLPSRTRGIIGARAPLPAGSSGLVADDVVVDMVEADAAPGDALCPVALPQALSAPASASPASAALTGVRFSMTAPPCRNLMHLGRGNPPAGSRE
jgi:hypothetical protein